MQVVSEFRWRIALVTLALTIALGAGLAWALARGAADPVRAHRLVLNENRLERLDPAGDIGGIRLYAVADAPAIDTLPFTIEINAVNEGEPRSAWGVWISTSDNVTDEVLPMLINDQGYVLAAFDSPDLQHHQFMHITAVENRLTLHIDADGIMTLRVNDEVVRTAGQADHLPLTYGVATFRNVQLEAFGFRAYAGHER